MKPIFKTSSFRPPRPEQWRKIVATMRNGFPLDFPVKVSRTKTAPSGCEWDWVAAVWCDYNSDGTIARAWIWVHADLPRCSAVEALQHEWAHLLSEEERPSNGDFPHDDLFWITNGKIYRAWQSTL